MVSLKNYHFHQYLQWQTDRVRKIWWGDKVLQSQMGNHAHTILARDAMVHLLKLVSLWKSKPTILSILVRLSTLLCIIFLSLLFSLLTALAQVQIGLLFQGCEVWITSPWLVTSEIWLLPTQLLCLSVRFSLWHQILKKISCMCPQYSYLLHEHQTLYKEFLLQYFVWFEGLQTHCIKLWN